MRPHWITEMERAAARIAFPELTFGDLGDYTVATVHMFHNDGYSPTFTWDTPSLEIVVEVKVDKGWRSAYFRGAEAADFWLALMRGDSQ